MQDRVATNVAVQAALDGSGYHDLTTQQADAEKQCDYNYVDRNHPQDHFDDGAEDTAWFWLTLLIIRVLIITVGIMLHGIPPVSGRDDARNRTAFPR